MAPFLKLQCMVVLLILSMFARTHTAKDTAGAKKCGQVSGNLAPCEKYLKNGGTVQPRCCDGVKSIVAAANTTEGRRTTCGCLKTAAALGRRVKSVNLQSLPAKCGVSMPYNISASTNCTSLK